MHLVGSLRPLLPLLLGAGAILLIVACANVANLLLARGVGRGREFAVRQALGASRSRLARQMLVESLVLAAVGGTLGLVLARWTLDAIARLRPLDVARIDQIPIDARAAAIACIVTIVAAIIAGLAPSIQLSRASTATALREGRTSARRGVYGTLVIAEVAAAVVLAVGAGLLVRSFMLVQRVDPGFSRERVSALQVFASQRLETPQKRIVFFQQAIDRLRALPGVVAAGGVTSMPFGAAKIAVRAPLAINGRPAASGEEALVSMTAIAGDYFRTMGVPLVKGRLFDASDTATSRQVVLVSRTAAAKFWPGADPVGSRVKFRFTGMNYDAEVVGVVGEVRHDALDRPPAAELFVPYPQSGFYALTLVVQTAPASPTTLQMMKEQVWALDPLQTIFRTAMVDEWISRSLDGRRFSLLLLGGFALATLFLALAGVYGVMSFTTGHRTREFGVRMALGAESGDIVRLVVGDGLKLTGLGVILGILAALPLTELLRAFLFGVSTVDPVTFLSVSVMVVLIAAAACYVPASRAIRVDPANTLRFD
jgi:putative ABC transport system permease protein